MKHSTTALSFLILAAVLGFQAQIIHATETEEFPKAKQGLDTSVFRLGFEESSDCCVSYSARIQCSKFVYYFPTGGCSMPGVIFVNKKGNPVCANPSDLKVQKCMKRLSQNS